MAALAKHSVIKTEGAIAQVDAAWRGRGISVGACIAEDHIEIKRLLIVLFHTGDYQRLYRIDGDRLGHLGVVVGSGGHHDSVGSVCELGAGEDQRVIGYGTTTGRGIGGESGCCVWQCP